MSGKAFIDTNVLVYANDGAFPDKQRRSRAKLQELLSAGNGVVSTQVLQEFYVASVRKLNMPPVEVRKQLDVLLAFETVDIDVALIKEAIDCSILDQINYWDALIVVAAARAGCKEVWTEGLNHGQTIKGIKVRNIFA